MNHTDTSKLTTAEWNIVNDAFRLSQQLVDGFTPSLAQECQEQEYLAGIGRKIEWSVLNATRFVRTEVNGHIRFYIETIKNEA